MKRRTTARKLTLLLVAVVAIAAAVTWVRSKRVQAATEIPTALAHKGEFLVVIPCRGELVARKSVQLTAPADIPDLQITWAAPPGSAIEAGQTVIRFDPSTAKQQLNERTAALRSAQANLDQAVAQSGITHEQDQLDFAKTHYEVEKAKLEASKESIVSAIQGEESKIDAGLAQQKQSVQEATGNLHQTSDQAKIASLRRLRDQEQNELNLIQHQLAHMELKAPNQGVINYSNNTSQGWMNAQPYKVGDHVFPGAILAEIPDLSTIEMEGKIDEVDRGRMELHAQVLVHIDAYPEKIFKGELRTVSPLTEQNFEWPPTRNFKGYATLDAPDSKLRPGMNASADVVIFRIPEAISIPSKALFTKQGKPVVYLKTNTGYEPKSITVLARNPDEIAVSGINPGAAVTLAEPPQEGSTR